MVVVNLSLRVVATGGVIRTENFTRMVNSRVTMNCELQKRQFNWFSWIKKHDPPAEEVIKTDKDNLNDSAHISDIDTKLDFKTKYLEELGCSRESVSRTMDSYNNKTVSRGGFKKKIDRSFNYLKKSGLSAESIPENPEILLHGARELKYRKHLLESIGIDAFSVDLIKVAGLKSPEMEEKLKECGHESVVKRISGTEVGQSGSVDDGGGEIDFEILHIRNKDEFLNSLQETGNKYLHSEATKLLKTNTYLNIQPKIQFLRSKGHSLEHILNNCFLLKDFSFKKIKTNYSELEDNHIECKNLAKLTSFIVWGKLHLYGRNQPRNKLEEAIGLPLKENLVPNKVLTLILRSQDVKVMKDNIEFLTGLGFSKDDISQLVVVIGHDSAVLQEYWNTVRIQYDIDLKTKEWREKKMIALNLLQYTIEKDVNFQTSVIVSGK